MKVRINDKIKFEHIDEFTGEKVLLSGEIIGNHKDVIKHFPEECGEADKKTFLVKVENQSGLFVIYENEILKIIK